MVNQLKPIGSGNLKKKGKGSASSKKKLGTSSSSKKPKTSGKPDPSSPTVTKEIIFENDALSDVSLDPAVEEFTQELVVKDPAPEILKVEKEKLPSDASDKVSSPRDSSKENRKKVSSKKLKPVRSLKKSGKSTKSKNKGSVFVAGEDASDISFDDTTVYADSLPLEDLVDAPEEEAANAVNTTLDTAISEDSLSFAPMDETEVTDFDRNVDESSPDIELGGSRGVGLPAEDVVVKSNYEDLVDAPHDDLEAQDDVELRRKRKNRIIMLAGAAAVAAGVAAAMNIAGKENGRSGKKA